MTDTSMTTIKVRQINKNKVYSFIYNARTTCKLHITQQLQMGLSTVTQNLKLLEEDGLIKKNGFFDSTGGRKADAIQIIPNSRISIGVAILQKMVQLVATDLYGQPIIEASVPIVFEPTTDYFARLGDHIGSFIHITKAPSHDILGVSIAIQGIISKDGQSVSYGTLLGNSGMSISQLQAYIPYPFRLEHDSKAAAQLELWNNPNIENGVVLLLNRNLGGAIITDRAVQTGDNMRSGTIEHLCMNTAGDLCYCGSYGCLETYCSANSLERISMMSIPDFFKSLREGDAVCKKTWEEYLDCLAFAIRNLSTVIDGTFVLSGYLAPFFETEDVDYLHSKINTTSAFPFAYEKIVLSTSGQFSQAIGTSLHFIQEFLSQI